MSNDRAIEVMARAAYVHDEASGRDWDRESRHGSWKDRYHRKAERQVEALASAGLQITDLTPEEAAAWLKPRSTRNAAERSAADSAFVKLSKFSRLSGATDA